MIMVTTAMIAIDIKMKKRIGFFLNKEKTDFNIFNRAETPIFKIMN